MTSVRDPVGSGKKKVKPKKNENKKIAKAGIINKKSDKEKRRDRIIILLIILIALILIILWIYFNISSRVKQDALGVTCVDFIKSISIEKACNLNENEIEIILKRIDDDFFVEKIEFEFFPSNSLWRVDSSKCLDIKVEARRYGSYCDIVDEEEQLSYIFNHSLNKQSEITLFVTRNTLTCETEKKEIKEFC